MSRVRGYIGGGEWAWNGGLARSKSFFQKTLEARRVCDDAASGPVAFVEGEGENCLMNEASCATHVRGVEPMASG